MTDNIILITIVTLWIGLMGILLKNVVQYYQKRKWAEMIVFSAIALTIVILSGGIILFFLFVLGCKLGLPLPCTL